MSTLKVDTIKDTSGVEVYTAKAWVNLTATGTPTIRGSGNVSSITDIDTGTYDVNFTNAMPDTYYCVAGASSVDAGTNAAGLTLTIGSNVDTTWGEKLTTKCRINVFTAQTAGWQDAEEVCAVFFR